MRVIIEGWGRTLLKLDLLPARKVRAQVTETSVLQPLDRDPHGTLSSQVEQAAEPPAGFGFGIGQVVSINDQRRKHDPDPEP